MGMPVAMRMWVGVLACVTACGVWTSPVQARGDNTEEAADATEEARRHFRRGVSLVKERAFRAAIIEFERAYELKPHYRLLYNIGQTYGELGDYLASSNALEKYLQDGGAEIPVARRDEVEKKLQQLADRIALISVTVNLAEVEVVIDDVVVGKSPLVRGVPVNLGRHLVSVRAPDGTTASRVVDVAGGDVRKVDFVLEAAEAPSSGQDSTPEETASDSERSRLNRAAVGSFVAAGAFAAGTLVALLLHQSEVGSFEDEIAKVGADPERLAEQEDRVVLRAAVTDVLGGLTLVAAAAATTMWLLDRRKGGSDRTQLQVGVGAGQLRFRGEF